ncbi:MAG: hypothetical protein ACYTAF_07715 [Planctomycetota bacterium]
MNPVLLVLLVLRLPPSTADTETRLERAERAVTFALALDAAVTRATCKPAGRVLPGCRPIWNGSRRSLGLWLLTLAWEETRLARHVHAGKCKPWECGGRPARWVSPWQISRSPMVSKALHVDCVGLELQPTAVAAWTAARIFTASWAHCPTPQGALACYMTGSRCTHPRAEARLRTYIRLESWATQFERDLPAHIAQAERELEAERAALQGTEQPSP